MDLKLKVCRGKPVSKIISSEAKSCGATSVIVGITGVHHTTRSRISVAKYCAKSLQKNVSVMCVDNGKIVFQRESTSSFDPVFGSLHESETRSKKRKALSKSPLSQPPQRVLSSSESGSNSIPLALLPIKTQETPESTSRWTLLRRVFLHSSRVSEGASTKKSSVVRWMLKLPSRQSAAAIYPDQKQISTSNTDGCCLDLHDDKGAIVLYSAENNIESYVNHISLEELKDLGEKYSTTCRLFTYQELLIATNNFEPG